jgi:transcriptional regulator with XRE-family HTH domain
MMDRAETVALFRQRLLEVVERSGLSRSAFAERCGIDRSTLSQILSDPTGRLPRADTLLAIGRTEQVSLDWLLGLSSDRGPLAADLVEQADVEFAGTAAPSDETLVRWRAEALGYKIRHVPATLPDLVKTKAVFDYEFRDAPVGSPEERHAGGETQLEYERRPETDTEVCSSLQSVETLARGEGIWRELPVVERRAQLRRMCALTSELYPTFRWFLYDARDRFAAPLTIFGPLRAAIYLGERYVVLNSRDAVASLTRHFDGLIRAAIVQPNEVSERFRAMADTL